MEAMIAFEFFTREAFDARTAVPFFEASKPGRRSRADCETCQSCGSLQMKMPSLLMWSFAK